MVIMSAGLMVIDRTRVAVVMPSATCTVKLDVRAIVGVPVMIPVDGGSDSPAGSEPIVRDQVYMPLPPDTAST